MGSPNDVEEIKSRLNLVDVVGSYLRLQRAGREYRGLCPFHSERTPSFYVNQEKQLWNCHGCHLGGDLFKFIELIDKTDFLGALDELAKRAGVDLSPAEPPTPAEQRQLRLRESSLRLNQLAADFYHEVLLNHRAGAAGRSFLEQRQVTADDIRTFHLGYAPAGTHQDNLVRYLTKHGASREEIAAAGLGRADRGGLTDFFRRRLTIPIRDERGRWLGFGGRALGDDQPKYLNTRTTTVFDKSRVLFGLDLAREAIGRERRATLMEGYFDVIGAHRVGLATAVSTSGTALTEVQVRLLRRFADEVVLCFDGDAAGQRAARSAVDLLGGAGISCRMALLPAGRDPDDLSRADPEGMRSLVEQAPPAWEVLVEQALGEASSQSGGQRQEALRRAMAVLAQIPEASLRELYAERVGRRLGIASGRILEDVERGSRPRSGPGPGLDSAPVGKSGMGASAHLLGLLSVKPELVTEVGDRYQVSRGDFPDPDDGALFHVMCEVAPARLSPESLPVNLAGRLRQVSDLELPELEEGPESIRLRRAIEDCVRTIRIEVAERTVADLRQRLAGEGHHRQGDRPALVAEMDAVRRRIELLRRGGGLEA
ncbi:MAG TPA: DNA primase [Candidatus Nanopelagicaceae bacterium]|nr:DNA primase [Candidatus Nanopelagicaceae bacterium]